jgi:hypothetical protein
LIKLLLHLLSKLNLLIQRLGVSMYIDSIVLYGLVIVALTCIMISYVGVYAYRHIKEDSDKAEQLLRNKLV